MPLAVHGAQKLQAVGRLMRGAPPELRREVFKGLQSATKPLRQNMKAEIPNALPRRGGLASLAHSRAIFTTRSKRGRDPSVSIVLRARKGAGFDVRILEAGRLRHPLFGNRQFWYTQTEGVKPKAMSKEFNRGRGDVSRRLDRTLDHLADELARRVGD